MCDGLNSHLTIYSRVFQGALSVFLIATLIAPSSPAEPVPQTRISSTAYRSTLDLSFRGGMESRDRGYSRTDDFSPNRIEKAEVSLLRLGLGLLGVRTEFNVELNLNHRESEPLVHVAYIKYSANSIVTVLLGQDRLLLGGWEAKEPAVYQTFLSNYLARIGKKSGAPFPETAPALTAAVNLGEAGDLLLQATDDVSVVRNIDTATYNKNPAQPAFMAQFAPVPRPVSPLIQIGTYDLNHSKYVVGGIKADIGRSHSTFDYTMDTRAMAGEPDPWVQRITSVVGMISYDYKNAMRPFIKFAAFESRKEGETMDANLRIGSCAASDCQTGNANELSVGAWFATPVTDLKPFLFFTKRSGRFLEADGTAGGNLIWKSESTASAGISMRL